MSKWDVGTSSLENNLTSDLLHDSDGAVLALVGTQPLNPWPLPAAIAFTLL